MTKELNPRCIQLDEVVDPDYYVYHLLEGYLSSGEGLNPEAMAALPEQ